jgi:hypothetical protein
MKESYDEGSVQESLLCREKGPDRVSPGPAAWETESGEGLAKAKMLESSDPEDSESADE